VVPTWSAALPSGVWRCTRRLPAAARLQVVRVLQPCYGPDRLLLITRPRKLGLGSAYAAGLLAARGSWVVLIDADLSHHPKHIPALVARQRATGADVVGGSRYLPGGGVAGWDLGRKLTSRGANVLARTLLGLRATDLTGAFRLYRRATLAALLGAAHCTGYAFQMEMMARAAAAGAAVEEVPIVFVDRLYGSSKLGPHEFAQFLTGLARLMLEL
jgi:dolichol-phosphate mannosyltransferase